MKTMMTTTFKKPSIDPEFQKMIPPLKPEELQQLTENIKRDGCREPLSVWSDFGILLDGHNRLRICEEHNIPYQIAEVKLPDRDAASDWIDKNQLGRRNLTYDQQALLIGRRYERAKKAEHCGENQKSAAGQNDPQRHHTASTIAADHGVSEVTVRRNARFAAGVEKLKTVDPDIESKVVAGKGPTRERVVAAAKVVDTSPEKAKTMITEPPPKPAKQRGRATMSEQMERLLQLSKELVRMTGVVTHLFNPSKAHVVAKELREIIVKMANK